MPEVLRAEGGRLPELAVSFFGNFTLQSLFQATAQLRKYVTELLTLVRPPTKFKVWTLNPR